MTGAWTFAGQPPTSPGVTLLEGASFCVSDVRGDISPEHAAGLFVRDVRVLSRWFLDLLPDPMESLAVETIDPTTAVFLSRRIPTPGEPATSVLVSRRRHVSQGLHETIEIHNLSAETVRVVPVLQVGADFADVLAIKSGAPASTLPAIAQATDDGLVFTNGPQSPDTATIEVRVRADHGPIVLPGQLLWNLELPARATATLQVEVAVSQAGRTLPRTPIPAPGPPAAVLRPLRRQVVTPSDDVERVVARSFTDVASLRMVDASDPQRAIVAAGAPWFMTLFGRDSLLTAWMLLPFSPELAEGTLAALAERQGTVTDPTTEEQPGRILHEVRAAPQTTAALAGSQTYYGSADSTPLFVMLVGEWSRWGATPEQLAPLLPHVDRALDWINGPGDPDQDGFVEVAPMTESGLINQGWQDSPDAIVNADGSVPRGPVALCEVQAYVYGALVARSELAERFGDGPTADDYRGRALAFKERFNDRFWLPERGHLAVALDADKRPVDACASNMGHALWTGVVAEEHAAAVAERLTDRTMFSGWGIRTLAADMASYNPAGYHTGAVWPHDSTIAAAGLMRYGFAEPAVQVLAGLFDAATAFDDHLPEVWCGFSDQEFPFPVPFPTSCSPQAWAAAAPLLAVRTLLGLDPDVPRGTLTVAPRVPQQLMPLAVSDLLIGGHRVTVVANSEGTVVEGAPPDWQVTRPGPPTAP